MNIAEEIFQRTRSESMAVIDAGVVYSYGDLNHQSAVIAAKLREHYSKFGIPRVGLRCRDGFAYIALALGILRSGGCFVPLASELSKAEQTQLIAKMGLDLVLTAEGSADGEIQFTTDPLVKEKDSRPALDSLNPAFIRFTSGTTGTSKGVVLSHETLWERIEAANSGLRIDSADRVLWVLSMSHHFAVSIMLYLWNGAAVIVPASHLPGDILAAANEHAATILYAAPSHYVFLTSGKEDASWPSLRLAVSTTAPLSGDTAITFQNIYGIRPAQALGVIELGLPFLNDSASDQNISSVGRIQLGFQMELRGDHGVVVPPGIPGELFVKGPGMFDAYIDPWKTRSEMTDSNGWFCTGDIAEVDSEGFLFLHGRTKSVINVGGMKFFPDDVETLLCSHPGVVDARVAELAHAVFGSVPIAEIVTSAHPLVTAPELFSLCRRELARYKVPVEFRFVDSIPRTPTGKIKRV